MRRRNAYEWRGRWKPAELLERRVLLALVYVDDTAPGPARDGATWATAFTDLQAALHAAAATAEPDEVRVAAGTYWPTARTDPADPRSATFRMSSGVSIVGGFPDGGGTSRDPAANVAALSGDVGVPGSAADNSYHVVTAIGVDDAAALDGFTITGGNANFGNAYFDPRSRGGGMYVSSASPRITDCTFSGNSADGPGASNGGGGMYNANGSAPTLTNCTFRGNSAGVSTDFVGGGGMHNKRSSPVLIRCSFVGNSANQGGGMANYIRSSPVLTDCVFSDNAAAYGGGMYNADTGSAPVLTRCTFGGNRAGFGGGITNVEEASPVLLDCTFSRNSAGKGGGMANMVDAFVTLTNCAFGGNTAGEGGGIYSSNDARLALTGCTFRDNSAGTGGGMANAPTTRATLTGCTFAGNRADFGGGGMHNDFSSPTLTGCTFDGNSARTGGGMYNDGYSSAKLSHCTFRGNSAESGGGVYNVGGSFHFVGASPTLTDCVFRGNSAALGGGMYSGGAAFLGNGAAPALTNCVFRGNSAQFGGGMYNGGGVVPGNSGATPRLTNCTFAGNDATNGAGGGMYNATGERPTDGSAAVLTNCILWGNRSSGGDGGAQIANAPGSTARVDHSLVQGGWAGDGNLDADPLFVRNPSPGGDGRWGTRQQPSPDDDFGDLRLQAGSPAIDAGDTTAVRVATDLARQPRVQGSAVDMGAYEYQPAVVYEAEQASVAGGALASNHAGFTGTGFVDYSHGSGDSVEFTVEAPSSGPYELRFRYANGGSGSRTMGLWVNGAEIGAHPAFARTGSWRTWGDLPLTVSLAAGSNKVRLLATGQSGPNLDSLSVRRLAPQDPVTYQAESATLSGPLALSDVAGYTGSGFADYQHRAGDFVEFTCDAPSAGDYVLRFRYASGSTASRPLELKVNGAVAEPRLAFAPTGRWSRWGTATATVALQAGANRIRLTSIGRSGPNLDVLAVTPASEE